MTTSVRTKDVLGDVPTFRSLLLPKHIVRNLSDAGYHRPSPIQHSAIPLARFGTDLIVQAKAGTGKTLVFAITSVELIDVDNRFPQILVLAPTREIALQAADCITDVAGAKSPISVTTLIGGLPTAEDERVLRRVCHAIVGTPGRIQSLIQREILVTQNIKLLVLDEADKLLSEGTTMRKDVDSIIGKIPSNHQTIAVSATFAPDVLNTLYRLMKHPCEVRLSQESSALLGVPHFYCVVESREEDLEQLSSAKSNEISRMDFELSSVMPDEVQKEYFVGKLFSLLHLLKSSLFQQAVVFCNSKIAASIVAENLKHAGISATDLSSAKDQLERIRIMNDLRDFALRVVVATDIAARGIDLDKVNLVVNFDLPDNSATLAHRLGRAGRFGTQGAAVSFVRKGEDSRNKEGLKYLQDLAVKAKGSDVLPLPSPLPTGWNPQEESQQSSFEKIDPGRNVEVAYCAKPGGNISRQEEGRKEDAKLPFDLKSISYDDNSINQFSIDSEKLDQVAQDIKYKSLWPDEDDSLPKAEVWPLQVADLKKELTVEKLTLPKQDQPFGGTNKVEAAPFEPPVSIPSPEYEEYEFSTIAEKEMDLPNQHYKGVVHSAYLDLINRETGDLKECLDCLEEAFQGLYCNEEGELQRDERWDEEGLFSGTQLENLKERRRRHLGSKQAVSYAEQVAKSELAAEAEKLEEVMLNYNGDDAVIGDEIRAEEIGTDGNEEAWRQYWLQHYEMYGYYPGGQDQSSSEFVDSEKLAKQLQEWNQTASSTGYVSVPAQLLARYLDLEEWYKKNNT